MSGGRGYNRKRGRDDDDDDGRGPPGGGRRRYGDGRDSSGRAGGGLSPRGYRQALFRLGSKDSYMPGVDILDFARETALVFWRDRDAVLDAFRTAVTELPHKMTHLTALIASLANSQLTPPPPPAQAADVNANGDTSMADGSSGSSAPVNIGREIVRDLAQVALPSWLASQKWAHARRCVCVLAHLAALRTPLVAPNSLVALLASFVSALQEPGAPRARSDACARIVADALIRLAGAPTDAHVDTQSLRDGVIAYVNERNIDKSLVPPFGWSDQLEDLVAIVAADSDESTTVPGEEHDDQKPSATATGGSVAAAALEGALPIPWNTIDDPSPEASAEPPLLLPMLEIPSVGLAARPESITTTPDGLRGDEGAGYDGFKLVPRILSSDHHAVPVAEGDHSATLVRALLSDMVDLYEVNRRDAVALLLDIPNWTARGLFSPEHSVATEDAGTVATRDDPPSRGWNFENMLVEAVIAAAMAIPEPTHMRAYYYSLLTELCRASPATVARALGRCIRSLYTTLGESESVLDPERVRVLTDWFATHLSNFSFAWGWQEWADDMADLSAAHPKRVFVERTLELEVRLSYYERIRGTVDDSLLEHGVMPADAPGPRYMFTDDTVPNAAFAKRIEQAIRTREEPDTVADDLRSFRSQLIDEDGVDGSEADRLMREVVTQAMLYIGSRSLSHFLNVVERYRSLFDVILSSSGDDQDTAAAQVDLLRVIASFWRDNAQFRIMVTEKLMQYGLVKPLAVARAVFDDPETRWSDINAWETICLALKLALARARGLHNLVTRLEREREQPAADDVAKDEAAAEEALQTAKGRQVEAEQMAQSVLVEIVQRFDEAFGSLESWEAWWATGWFAEFSRANADVLNSAPMVAAITALHIPAESPVALMLQASAAWKSTA